MCTRPEAVAAAIEPVQTWTECRDDTAVCSSLLYRLRASPEALQNISTSRRSEPTMMPAASGVQAPDRWVTAPQRSGLRRHGVSCPGIVCAGRGSDMQGAAAAEPEPGALEPEELETEELPAVPYMQPAKSVSLTRSEEPSSTGL